MPASVRSKTSVSTPSTVIMTCGSNSSVIHRAIPRPVQRDSGQARQCLRERTWNQHRGSRRQANDRVLEQRHECVGTAAQHHGKGRLLSQVWVRAVQPRAGLSAVASETRHQREATLDRSEPRLNAHRIRCLVIRLLRVNRLSCGHARCCVLLWVHVWSVGTWRLRLGHQGLGTNATTLLTAASERRLPRARPRAGASHGGRLASRPEARAGAGRASAGPFSAAMMGQLDVVKAFIAARPGVQRNLGAQWPHPDVARRARRPGCGARGAVPHGSG